MCFPIVAVYISYETVIAAKASETKSPRAGLGNGPSWAKPGSPRTCEECASTQPYYIRDSYLYYIRKL